MEGQKNRTVIGITTSVSSPLELTTLVDISTSGVITDKYCLNAKESLDKNSLNILNTYGFDFSFNVESRQVTETDFKSSLQLLSME